MLNSNVSEIMMCLKFYCLRNIFWLLTLTQVVNEFKLSPAVEIIYSNLYVRGIKIVPVNRHRRVHR